MAIEINAEDVERAETFLENLLTEEIPEGRFTEGSALRDLTVKALAFAFAHLKKENATSRSLQSLLSVRDIATGDPDTDRAVSQATDAILSNWFVNRKMGAFARGLVFVDVTRRQDYVIPGNHRFTYDRIRGFYPDVVDASQNIVIRADQLLPIVSVEGTIESYQFSLRLIAAKTGDDYNVAPATWLAGTSFSPYATKVYSTTKYEGGRGRETTPELIERAQTSISVRNLINPRSIEATLREKFSLIQEILVLGMGDREMLRDLKLGLHVGGHTDVYLSLPTVQQTFEGLVGGRFVRPDGIVHVFRDPLVPDWKTQFLDFQNRPVYLQPGDVIRVASGLPEAPKDFVIREVDTGELRVGTNTPFSEATEDDSSKTIAYYIFRPLYGTDYQVYPPVGASVTGQTSRYLQKDNAVILPGGAHYEIADVAVVNPDTGDVNINPATGFVHFPNRVNGAPGDFEYQIFSEYPELAQSMHSFDELRIKGYEGKQLRVVYESQASLDVIHDFTRDRFERVVVANTLVKGFTPVYLSLTVPYRLRAYVTSQVDENALRQTIVDHINSFDPRDIIDVSDISYVVRDFDENIGAVLPFGISYTLISPDGRIIEYTTADEVRLDPSKIDPGQTLADFPNMFDFGISDRTVRYRTTLARVLVAQQD